MEHYSALEKGEGDSDTCYKVEEYWRHYAQWNKPDSKDKYCVISLTEGLRIETENRMVIDRGHGKCLMRIEFQFGMVKSSGDDAGDVGTTMSMCLALKIAAMVNFTVCIFYHNKTKFLNKRSG